MAVNKDDLATKGLDLSVVSRNYVLAGLEALRAQFVRQQNKFPAGSPMHEALGKEIACCDAAKKEVA